MFSQSSFYRSLLLLALILGVMGATPSILCAANTPPATPSILNPPHCASNQSLTPTLVASAYYDADGDAHVASQWKISLGTDSVTVIWDTGTTFHACTEVNVPAGVLYGSTLYTCWVRYEDARGAWSQWDGNSFVTMPGIELPNRPGPLSPSNGSTQGLTPSLYASNYSDPDGDAQSASQWQVDDNSDFSSPVWDSGPDYAAVTDATVPEGYLLPTTSYYWRVRYREVGGIWSYWSTVFSFNTGSRPDAPGLLSPTDGAVGCDTLPALYASDFVDSHGAYFAGSQWQVDDTNDFSHPEWDSVAEYGGVTRVRVPAGRLNYATQYYWRVRYRDNIGMWSNWSVVWRFTTRDFRPVIYVNAAATGAESGLNWSDAYKRLDLALAVAGPGEEVWVAAGTYRPEYDDNDANSWCFSLQSGVKLYGGFAGIESARQERNWNANATILSADTGDPCQPRPWRISLVICPSDVLDSAAILDGFTIADGCGGYYGYDGFGGAGLYASGRLTVANCIFAGNASDSGGAVYCDYGNMSFTNCIFNNNTATYGGAICASWSNPVFIDCQFRGNSSFGGGAVYCYLSAPSFENCTFTDNSAEYGGAILGNWYSGGLLTNCSFSGNVARYDGGAVCNIDSGVTAISCTFSANKALNGAAFYNWRSDPNIVNCVFYGNSATGSGGAVFGDGSSSAELANCTIYGNSAAIGGAICDVNASTTFAFNCVLWANSAVVAPQCTGGCNISNSDVQGGWSGSTNIDADPLFIREPNVGSDGVWGTADDDQGNLRLRAGSLCLDAGINEYVPSYVTTDMDGWPRLVDGNGDGLDVVDMGAYERRCSTSPVQDIVGDCGVGFADYAVLMSKWLKTDCSATNGWCVGTDLDHSGTVDVLDLSDFISHWME